jgi:hypothetical protein
MVSPEIVQIVFSAKYRCNEVRIFILAKRNDKKNIDVRSRITLL